MLYPELLKLMAYKGMARKDLAKILNITPQALSKKMLGRTEFKRNEMQRIKKYFQDVSPGITMDQIFEQNIFLP
ncbi:MAG: helix-turn-helix transcriptional regulator [Bacillota bacterium]|nr:helix-turn-helix transcriptional regulator [Bacillota bacterium]